MTIDEVLEEARTGRRPSADAALALADADSADLQPLMALAAELRDAGHGGLVTYSPKVFIPLTQLCRDVCHYCTFAHPPRPGEPVYLDAEAVLAIARAGAEAGCHEALFTLGDKPELRYAAARDALARLGHETTLSYLAEMAGLVLRETGLLPHLNPGLMTRADLDMLRRVSASQGIMLESASERLRHRGGPHFGSPDKDPARRLDTIRAAGEAAAPFTSGILIGIGETRRERIEALLALRDLHERYGHIQEIIIQNFRAKPATRMAAAPEPDLDDHLWTIAAARLIFGPQMNLQAPPNLNPGALAEMIAAGINDWGGVSPVTRDHVNPEAPWPALDHLARETAAAGKVLAPRLAIYPEYAREPERWLDPALRTPVLRAMDGEGLARPDAWIAGSGSEPPLPHPPGPLPSLPRMRGRVRVGARRPSPAMRERGLSAAKGVRGSSPPSSTGPPPARRSARPRSCSCSRRAATALPRCARRPTGCAGGSTATPSAMSSPATSTTPTCAISAASSAPSPRASSAKTCAAGPTTSTCRRSSAGSRKPGSAAPPRSACKAASTRNTPAPPISGSAARSRRRCPASTSTPSRRSRSGKAPRPWAAPSPTSWAS